MHNLQRCSIQNKTPLLKLLLFSICRRRAALACEPRAQCAMVDRNPTDCLGPSSYQPIASSTRFSKLVRSVTTYWFLCVASLASRQTFACLCFCAKVRLISQIHKLISPSKEFFHFLILRFEAVPTRLKHVHWQPFDGIGKVVQCNVHVEIRTFD